MDISVSNFFSKIKDPRINRKKLYPLEEVLLVALCSIISGAEGFEDMVLYGQNKLLFLRKIYTFKHGIPSYHTFRRVFMLINPEDFKECFVRWVKDLQARGCKHIAIDGKLARRTSGKGQNALHLVSAWASDGGLVLAQQRVENKSNEINAIPDLLEILDIKGCVVTIDAMGCQKSIAKKIIDKEGDYVFGLKGNHKNLNEEVKEVFEGKRQARFIDAKETTYETLDKGHGRLETRKYRAIAIENLPINVIDWSGIQSIVEVTSIREIGEKKSEEKRYYISSLEADASKQAQHIRGHWGIENGLHWIMDVTFNEDQSRIRTGYAAENLAIVRHTSLNLIKKEPSKGSVRGKRKKAGWNDDYLLEVLSK
jgi:predicted transposase YbfD/YdcC